jgi:hypothetical protein
MGLDVGSQPETMVPGKGLHALNVAIERWSFYDHGRGFDALLISHDTSYNARHPSSGRSQPRYFFGLFLFLGRVFPFDPRQILPLRLFRSPFPMTLTSFMRCVPIS